MRKCPTCKGVKVDPYADGPQPCSRCGGTGEIEDKTPVEYGPVTDLESHKRRHKFLHRMLDELLADWITHTGGLPSKCQMDEFLKWSSEQRENPTGPHE